MSQLANGLVAVAAVGAWGIWAVVVPSVMRSRLRSKLWAVRDALVDDLEAGLFTSEVAEPHLLYSQIQRAVCYASELTVAKLLVFRVVFLKVPAPENARMVDLTRISDPRERDRLEKHLRDFTDALASHLLLGSPSGWVLFVLLTAFLLVGVVTWVPFLLILRVFRRRSISRAIQGLLARIWQRISGEQVEVLPQLGRTPAWHGTGY